MITCTGCLGLFLVAICFSSECAGTFPEVNSAFQDLHPDGSSPTLSAFISRRPVRSANDLLSIFSMLALSRSPTHGTSLRNLPGVTIPHNVLVGSPITMKVDAEVDGEAKEKMRKRQLMKLARDYARDGKGGFQVSTQQKQQEKAARLEQKKKSSEKGFGVKKTTRNRKPAASANCACGTGLSYASCCSKIHEEGVADNPLSLARALYTAYSYRLPDFIIAASDPEERSPDWTYASEKKSLLKNMDDMDFQKFNVRDDGSEQSDSGKAKLTVDYLFANIKNMQFIKMTEESNFRQTADGTWLYSGGTPKIAQQSADDMDTYMERTEN